MDFDKLKKIFYIISQSDRQLTKLAIKQQSGYSMSTVIDAVELLCTHSYVLNKQISMPYGGKPHSNISANPTLAFGIISHKNGFLELACYSYGLQHTSTFSLALSASGSIEQLAVELISKAPQKPIAIALTFRLRDFDLFKEMIKNKTQAISYYVSKQEACYYFCKYVLRQQEMLFLALQSSQLKVVYKNAQVVRSEYVGLENAADIVEALALFISCTPICCQPLPFISRARLITEKQQELGAAALLFENGLLKMSADYSMVSKR